MNTWIHVLTNLLTPNSQKHSVLHLYTVSVEQAELWTLNFTGMYLEKNWETLYL